MKIAFIETPSPWLVRPYPFVPLGPLYLVTILDQAGHQSRLARPKTREDFIDLGNEYDVIAFGGTTLGYLEVVKYAELIKKETKVKIWYGGPHATITWKELLGGPFDSIAIGEAEDIILEMVNDLELGDLRSTYQATSLIQDLDKLPFPDKRLIEGSFEHSPFAFGENFIGDGCTSIIISRGCPYKCLFCSSKLIWGNHVRSRSFENIEEEIFRNTEKGIYQFRFQDDNLFLNSNRVIEFCDKISKGPQIAWKCSQRGDSLTREVCESLFNAGCKEIAVGIESGDQVVLDFIQKDENLDEIRQGCINAYNAGINIRGLFITGLPGESEQTSDLTIDFIKNTPLHCITLSQFVPYPGSPVYENPDIYDCEILTKDYTKYNRDFNVKGNEEREFGLLIRNKRLTEEQQQDNINKMETYMLNSPLANQG